MFSVVDHAKKLCMTEMRIAHIKYDSEHIFEPVSGRECASFGFVLEGEVTLNSMGRRITAKKNGLFYIPEGVHCRSEWYGKPNIEFYAIYIVSKKHELPDPGTVYAMQKIDEMSCEATRGRIEEIYALLAAGERVKQVRALGLYYLLYADILPYMEIEDAAKYNPLLERALSYIEKNYTNEFMVDELARACSVSESRLFHLFKDELATTPVRYRNEVRIERASHDLRTTGLGIDEIAARHGFNSSAYFRETFKRATGLSPTEYRAMTK